MRAVRVAQPGPSSVLCLQEGVPVPQLALPRDVLVRNAIIGVNYIDTYHR